MNNNRDFLLTALFLAIMGLGLIIIFIEYFRENISVIGLLGFVFYSLGMFFTLELLEKAKRK